VKFQGALHEAMLELIKEQRAIHLTCSVLQCIIVAEAVDLVQMITQRSNTEHLQKLHYTSDSSEYKKAWS
jgi:hypothetical protein